MRLSSNAPVFEVECGSGSSLRLLSRRRRRLADDEPEIYEIAEDDFTKTPWEFFDGRMEVVESDDPMFDGGARGVRDYRRWIEEAANLMLTLCQQSVTEKHGKSCEIQRHVEVETRRAIRYIVEETYRGRRISPSPETMCTTVYGILGATRKMRTAPRSFASRSRNGSRSFNTCSHKMFGREW